MKKILYLAAAIALMASITACQEDLGITSRPQPGAEQVTVSLSLGFADEEDGFTVSASDTRANTSAQKGSFDAQLTPTVHTRTDASKPDKLYELRILQYDLSGALMNSQSFSSGTSIGAELSVSLNAMDDCQLVILACGEGNGSLRLGSNISELQNLTLTKEYFDNIPADGTATAAQMNKMPYILHLPHVEVGNEGLRIQSVEGAHDARLLLKRLAAKLTLTWNNNLTQGAGYAFKEVRLCQIPSLFRILPAPTQSKWGMTYPSIVAEYIDYYRLTGDDLAAGKKTVWIPANVRGTSPASSTDNYRTKANAPDAASYAEIVVDNSSKNERLYYRAYLGGEDPTDFNLRENTDYAWTLNINSTNYREDARIQLLDQTPVKSTNEVPTSNCFMMQPGTNICFNPYKHEAGTGGWNTYLTNDGSAPATDKTIASVKVLWQNKDAGTSGDLVMGYVIDDNNHINLVNYTDIGSPQNARVHVRVPVTQGGNAVIAAYNSSGVIVWSWHIWISDYVPATVVPGNITDEATRKAAIRTAQAATLGGTVHAYLGTAWTFPNGAYRKNVIMDRNLGAIRNTYSKKNDLEAARAYGYLYQWGRKDPFFGSVDGTANEIGVIFDGDGRGIELGKVKAATDALKQSIQNPASFIKQLNLNTDSWGGASKEKTLYDPCPAGWRVPIFTNDATTNIFQGMEMGTNTQVLVKGEFLNRDYEPVESNFDVKNGFLYNEIVWLPAFRLREAGSGELRTPYLGGSFVKTLIPSYGAWSAVESSSIKDVGWYIESQKGISATPDQMVATKGYGFSIRCIQE